MFNQSISAAGILVLCAGVATAQSEPSDGPHEQWGESGGWIIKIDPSVGNGCYMEKTMDDGTLVQVGFVPDQNGGFFAAYNVDWTDIEDGAAGTIRFDFVQSLFEGEYVGVIKDELFGGYAFFNNPEFIKEFGKRNEVSIKGDGEDALSFKLTGTSRAISETRNCDAEQSQ
jgi:hypothetical protein